MNVNELLNELRRNILRDSSAAISADDEDFLWTDEALLSYINDAYYRFCHLTEYLQDATTPEVCRIALQTGVTDYTLDASVIRVLSVEHKKLVIPVNTTDHMFGDLQDSPGYTRVRREDYPGVFAVVPDYQIGTLKVVGNPTVGDVTDPLRLRVSRYPLARLSFDGATAEPEIPERFHLDLLEWAAFRALRNHDVDAENMAKASAHSTRFERAVEEVRAEFKARKFARVGYTESWGWN